MKVNVTKIEVGKYTLEVEISAEKWTEARTKAFQKLAKNVTVQGFRKGKAPEHLVRAKVDQAQELEEAIKGSLNDAFTFGLTESKLTPVMQPTYEVSKVSDSELVLVFHVVTAPEVKLGDYTGLTIGRDVPEISDDAVDAKLQSLREQNAELILKDEAAVLGDTVVLDFEGFVDGVAFEGGKADNHELELGSGSFIPGFEDALVGVKAGESRDVNVTFPENYHENLKNKKAVFKTLTHEVKTKSLPELDDAFAASLNLANVTDVASLRVHTLFELTKEGEEQAKTAYLEKLMTAIREKTTFEVSEDIIHEEGHQMQHDFEHQITGQGMTWEDYLTMSGETNETVHDRFHEQARLNIQNYLIRAEISVAQEIVVSDADVDFEIAKMAQMYGMGEKQVREVLGENLNNLKSDIRNRRVNDFLLENNN